jgi:IS605 OrfB family transposase
MAQRARKKRRAKTIHARIANSRSDFLHNLSNRLVREFDYIAVGNVNAAALARTKMAKSARDASWSLFRTQLAYKAAKHGACVEEVSESFTSQVCSGCGAMPHSRPKGIADLGIREWTCGEYGAEHDRDVNAAKNILSRIGLGSGRETAVLGISALESGGEDVKWISSQ